jgi:hypothetical protein
MGAINAVLYQKYSFTSQVNLSRIKSYETVDIRKPASILLNIINAFELFLLKQMWKTKSLPGWYEPGKSIGFSSSILIYAYAVNAMQQNRKLAPEPCRTTCLPAGIAT